MPKYTLLEMVQKILSDMDAEPVNALSETTESDQVASIIEDTYYALITNRTIPEHKGLIKLTAFADSTKPTHFKYPDNVNNVVSVWYDTSSDGSFEYSVVEYLQPLDFLHYIDNVQDDYQSVVDVNGGTTLRIANNKQPEYYTSFDDTNIVMDSWDSSVDSTLQTSKSRAFGTTYPTFTLSDSFVPDIDENVFPYLLAESKSTAMSLLVGGSDPKIEQQARRQKSYIQNDRYRTQQANKWSHYGRS